MELNQIPNTISICLDLGDNGLHPTSDLRHKPNGLGSATIEANQVAMVFFFHFLPLVFPLILMLDPNNDFQWPIAELGQDLDIVLGAA